MRSSLPTSLLAATALIGAGLLTAPGAAAGSSVDPSTLSPPPPPGATCQQDGRFVLCNTFVNEDPAGEQFDELPCGWLYVNGPDRRLGTRWYEAGVLVRRLVRQDVDQTLSLSPDGSGPTLKVTAHDSWWGLADGALAFHGNGVTISAPGAGVLAHIAGYDDLDGNHHGVLRWLDDPATAAAACTALT